MVLEATFKTKLCREIEQRFPGSYVFRLDTSDRQGVPDLLVIFENMWAMLEGKRKRPTSPDDFEPNQEWYIEEFDRMSFAACIYPENKEEVLNEMEQAFLAARSARLSQRQ